MKRQTMVTWACLSILGLSIQGVPTRRMVGGSTRKTVWRAAIDNDISALVKAPEGELEAYDEHGNTPLILAAFMGNVNAVNWLCLKGVPINQKDANGWTAFTHAVLQEHEGVARLLEQYGADVDACNRAGYSALDLALHSGQDNAAALLFNLGACMFSLTGPRNADGSIPVPTQWCCEDMLLDAIDEWYAFIGELFTCAACGHIDDVERLLDCGISPDVRDKNNIPLIIKAAAHNREDVIALLVARGAQIDARDKTGCTALHHTVPLGNVEAAAALLSAGASPTVKTKNGRTPRDFAHNRYENEAAKTSRCCDIQLMNRCTMLMKMFQQAEREECENQR